MFVAIFSTLACIGLVSGVPMPGQLPQASSSSLEARSYVNASISTSTVINTTRNNEILHALKDAITPEDRFNLLVPDPSDTSNITFQFVNNSVIAPTAGTIDLATVEMFPALFGSNLAMALGFVDACGLNTPHAHTRANEFLTILQGQLTSGFIMPNNPGSFGDIADANIDPDGLMGPLAQANTDLTLYQGIMYPQGVMHWQFNPTCEPALFVAAFDSNDPGRMQAGRAFFSIDSDEVINAALGDSKSIHPKNIDKIRQHLPSSYAQLISECAVKCGISTET